MQEISYHLEGIGVPSYPTTRIMHSQHNISMLTALTRYSSLSLCLLLAATTLADEVDETKEKAHKQRQQIAKELQVAFKNGEAEGDLKLHPKPIYRYHEVARGFHHATTWMWSGKAGRPAMILNLSGGQALFYEFMSLANSPLICKVRGVSWTPTEKAWKPTAIPGAKEPGKSRPIRLVQMRSMARRFSAYQMDHEKNDRKHHLRMLPQPIHRYPKESKEALDGALFAFVRDGDLEVILTIEATKQPAGGASWVFDCDRVAIFEQHVDYNKQEVWSCPRTDFGSPADEYYVRVLQTPIE